MSYCRWSSLNWRCDLYCYEHVDGGFVTHVAGNRVVGDIPTEPSWDLIQTDPQAWSDQHSAVMKFLETATREPITLPEAGACFTDPTLATFKERLLWLRQLGYVFPDYVLEDVDEEIAAEHA